MEESINPTQPKDEESKPKRKLPSRDKNLKLVAIVLIVALLTCVALIIAWVVTKEIILFVSAVVVLLLALLTVAPYYVRRVLVYRKMQVASPALRKGEYQVTDVAYTKHMVAGIMSRHIIVQLSKGKKTYDKRFILDRTFFNARGRREWEEFCEGIGVQPEGIESFLLSNKDANLVEFFLRGLVGKTYEKK